MLPSILMGENGIKYVVNYASIVPAFIVVLNEFLNLAGLFSLTPSTWLYC